MRKLSNYEADATEITLQGLDLESQESEDSLVKAVEKYERATLLGEPIAMYRLAMLIERGAHKEKNNKRVLQLLEKSAELGSELAEERLGWKYLAGEGVAKDFEKAFMYCQKAADKNVPKAILHLAVCHEKGKGTNVDGEKAFHLYNKARDLGEDVNLEKLKELHHKITFAKRDLQLFEASAQKGQVDSIIQLADFYLNGLVYQDHNKARQLLEQAIVLGSIEACTKLGMYSIYILCKPNHSLTLFKKQTCFSVSAK